MNFVLSMAFISIFWTSSATPRLPFAFDNQNIIPDCVFPLIDLGNDRLAFQELIVSNYKGNVRNAIRIMQVIELFESPDEKMVGYRLLFDEMERHRHLYSVELMTMAYRINENKHHPQNADYIWIRDRLPESVRKFPWNKVIRIQNKEFPEYVYSPADDLTIDGNRRPIYSWGEPACDDKVCQFRIRPKASDLFSVRIVNFQTSESLYAGNSETLYDNERRSIYFWRKPVFTMVGGDSWMFEPIIGQMSFRIFNTFYGEYLYAAQDDLKYDNGRRRLFTWMPLGCDGNQCVFNVNAI